MNTNKTFEALHDAQSKLIYSMIVAGKSADFADKAARNFLENLAGAARNKMLETLPLKKSW